MESLQTERLLIRSFEERDTDMLLAWENDLSVWSSALTLNPLSHKFIKDYILYSTTSILDKGELVLLAETLQDHKPIGYIQLLDYEPLHQKLAIGVYVSPDYRQQAYGGELIRFAKAYAFDILHCRMVYAQTLLSNEPACKLFESLGFERTAVLPKWFWLNGSFEDLVYYQIWS